jgi:hypothetical protein
MAKYSKRRSRSYKPDEHTAINQYTTLKLYTNLKLVQVDETYNVKSWLSPHLFTSDRKNQNRHY